VANANAWAVRRVNDVVADDLGWHFGKEPLPDYGVDAQLEIVAADKTVTGRLLGLQIKGGAHEAWNKIYALKPDPGGAYADSVRAVEAVACPLFLPAADSPTLGQVRAHLDQARSIYELVIANKGNVPASIDVIVEMIGTLWFGHRDRHEGGPTSGPISPESAEAAVSLAVSLVHLLSSGAIRRKPDEAG
jgi:hypothetical protein